MSGLIRNICWLVPLLVVCGRWERDNPVDPKGTNWNPPVVTAMRDTTVNINDSLTISATASGSIEKFLWAKNGMIYADITTAGAFQTAWPDSGSKTVIVKAVDENGVQSEADTCIVRVTLDPPVVTAMSDTTVGILDSLTITATAKDNGTIVKYFWAKNGGSYSDTTTTGAFKTSWRDSGHVVVRVKVMDDDNVFSLPDSCVVFVMLNPPTVSVIQDTTININDSLTITATGKDNQVVAKYAWAKDGITFSDTTQVCSVGVAFSDSGRKVVRVKAIDDDGVASAADSCVVIVTLDAPVVKVMRDTTVNINDSMTITAAGKDNGSVVKFVWAKNGVAYSDTSMTGSLKVAYSDSGRMVVRVKVVDDDGEWSGVDSCVVHVTLDVPVVAAMRDTTVNIKDSLTITATGSDNGSVMKFVWAKDGITYGDTSLTGSLKVAYSDSGRIVVRVKVVDDDGVVSVSDSCVVVVTLNAPVVAVMRDTTVNINDSLTITATASDNGSMVKYVWAKNGVTYSDTSLSGSLKVAYSNSGRIVVRVKAIDDDGVASEADSCIVTITMGKPLIANFNDTIVPQKANISIAISAKDTNAGGKILMYYWDVGMDGWDDSSTNTLKNFTNPDGGSLNIITGVRDDDNLMAYDTFSVRFNHGPEKLNIVHPRSGDTVICFSRIKTSDNGLVRFGFIADDLDGSSDSLFYRLMIGTNSASLNQVYFGNDTTYAASELDTNCVYFWKLIVIDRIGDSAIISGNFITSNQIEFDTIPPNITLFGKNPDTTFVGVIWKEPGFSAFDAYDGDITKGVQIIGGVDNTVLGKYVCTYSVSDSAGNSASIQRAVVVRNPIELFPAKISVPVTYYDFHSNGSNPDFNPGLHDGASIHANLVGPNLVNGLPVPGTSTFFSRGVDNWFKQWTGPTIKPAYTPYTGTLIAAPAAPAGDTSYVNMVLKGTPADELVFNYVKDSDGMYEFPSQAFWPLDGRGFGSEPSKGPTAADPGPYTDHNYSFTMYLHLDFFYKPGLTFTFYGDDDLWVFINNKVVLDIGGIHGPKAGVLTVDDLAFLKGLSAGTPCSFDLFYAERQAVGSNFKITTNIIALPSAKLD
jgi:fibro-slime domain-containing protein